MISCHWCFASTLTFIQMEFEITKLARNFLDAKYLSAHIIWIRHATTPSAHQQPDRQPNHNHHHHHRYFPVFGVVFFSTIWHFGQFLLISEHFLYILRSIVHADFWLLLFCIIFSASLPEISIFKTFTLVVRTIQHKPLTETLRFLSAFSFEFYEFRLQKLFFSPFVVLLSIEAKKSFVAFLVVFLVNRKSKQNLVAMWVNMKLVLFLSFWNCYYDAWVDKKHL